jgi:GAF domain-containing protein
MTTEPLLQELSQVANALVGVVEPPGSEGLLRSLAETARRLLGARACSLALLSEDGTELVYTTAVGDGAEAVAGLRLPVGRGIAGWVVQSGQPVAVSDVGSDPRFAPDVASATGYVPQSLVAAPVVSESEVLGVLSVLDRDATRPGADDDLLLLQVFCQQAAIALETARSFRQVADVLLGALSAAAAQGTELAAQLRPSHVEQDSDLRRVAEVLARIAEHDPAARQLALTVVSDVLSFVERRSVTRPET